MIRKLFGLGVLIASLAATAAQARVVSLEVQRREPILSGKQFGPAGAYEKLIGKVHFALDPKAAINQRIVDLNLAPKNAKGEVEFTADFFMLKPADPKKGNHRLFYEVGNRGGKSMLRYFQKAKNAKDPASAEEIGDGALMNQGWTLLWMGWQWDVPPGQMRMDQPIATDNGKPITGLVRGNFVPNDRAPTQSLADRNHFAYPIADPNSPQNVMTVRDNPADTPQVIPRGKWHFTGDIAKGDAAVTLDGGFQMGRIYDVVYLAKDTRVVGTGLSGTRDLISFLKHDTGAGNPMPGIQYAYGWGVSQSGRFLRQLLYEGFNEDEQHKIVFDGVIDEVGGSGRGSFNLRFGQASRDAEEFFDFFYPVDQFPFTDSAETDPVTGQTSALLADAEAHHVRPKLFHIFSNSEYFNRGGSLLHTDVTGTKDIAPPADSRIYFVSSGPHAYGPTPPKQFEGAAAFNNPLNRDPIVRALLKDMDDWVTKGVTPPDSRIPHIADGTLVPTAKAGWPKIPGVPFPVPNLGEYRLDFGPDYAKGIVREPPKVGQIYVNLVPAVDEAGNSRAGIRLPAIAMPVGTYGGWNFRDPAIGRPDQLFGEMGSFHPMARTKDERMKSGDSRLSIAERYKSRDEYIAKVTAVANQMVKDRFLLPEDIHDPIDQAVVLYDWAVKTDRTQLQAISFKPGK
ncbi:MAG TPA: alpha/beta hydrolase domain-containing protein [Rhizomicrobium sp.]|nr:alpha/beta hydrolase domain-containing protein [Rhizomicrobium sp.]